VFIPGVWKGRWAASPTGADFQAIVSALLELKDEAATLAWLQAMKTNSVAYRGNGAVLKAVNSGQIEAGVIYHYYYLRDQTKTGENSGNAALYYFKGQDPGAFVSIFGGGVLASSKHQVDAQSFLRWVTGHAGAGRLKDGDAYEYVSTRARPPIPSSHR
jgi:iron(III) transport system substrate-binding protein